MSQPVPMPIVVARRVAGAIFILSLVVVLVGIALLASWYVTRPIVVAVPSSRTSIGSSGGTLSATSQTTAATPTTTLTATPSPPKSTKAERERAAMTELQRVAAADLESTDVASGQWVAQLSSKYIGVKDKLQTTKTGSHTFGAVDILGEHRSLLKRFSKRHEVRLLRGEDFYPYKTTKNGDTFWYIFVIGDFGSKAEVMKFCRAAYSNVAGEALENRCLPRELGY